MAFKCAVTWCVETVGSPNTTCVACENTFSQFHDTLPVKCNACGHSYGVQPIIVHGSGSGKRECYYPSARDFCERCESSDVSTGLWRPPSRATPDPTIPSLPTMAHVLDRLWQGCDELLGAYKYHMGRHGDGATSGIVLGYVEDPMKQAETLLELYRGDSWPALYEVLRYFSEAGKDLTNASCHSSIRMRVGTEGAGRTMSAAECARCSRVLLLRRALAGRSVSSHGY
jgi:hypothetical protein